MKRCPECRRDYVDDSLLYCLEDGAALVQGSVPSPEGPATALMAETARPSEAATRIQKIEVAELLPGSVRPWAELRGSGKVKHWTKYAAVIGAFVLVLIGGFLAYRYFSAMNSIEVESIAVLPFFIESGNPEAEYLADGMTETLISSLSKLPDLKVKARTSVFRYKGKELTPQQIAGELNVQLLIIGHVTQRDDNLSVNLELVDPRTEDAIWSERYNRKLTDLFSIQDEIAGRVAEQLRARLSKGRAADVVKRSTNSIKAFQYYTHGRSIVHRRTRDDLLAAIQFYEKAIAEDPEYALAFAGLADAYSNLGVRGFMSPVEARRKATESADKALALDDSLAEAHFAVTQPYLLIAPYDHPRTDRELKRALELSPSLAMAYQYLGISRAQQGRIDESIEQYSKARELDPLSSTIARGFAFSYYLKRDNRRALELLDQANELGPPWSIQWEISVYIQNGLLEKALISIEKARQERKNDPILTHAVGMVFAAQGRKADALRHLTELERMSGADMSQAQWIAQIYASLNDKEMALSWLERGFAAGSLSAVYKDEPVWDGVRQDNRFQRLLRQIGVIG